MKQKPPKGKPNGGFLVLVNSSIVRIFLRQEAVPKSLHSRENEYRLYRILLFDSIIIQQVSQNKSANWLLHCLSVGRHHLTCGQV